MDGTYYEEGSGSYQGEDIGLFGVSHHSGDHLTHAAGSVQIPLIASNTTYRHGNFNPFIQCG